MSTYSPPPKKKKPQLVQHLRFGVSRRLLLIDPENARASRDLGNDTEGSLVILLLLHTQAQAQNMVQIICETTCFRFP